MANFALGYWSIGASTMCGLLLAGCMNDDRVKEMSNPNSDWGKAWQACDNANSYDEAYGTPPNPGPCWHSTTTTSKSANVEVYEIVTIKNKHAILTYSRGELFSVTESR